VLGDHLVSRKHIYLKTLTPVNVIRLVKGIEGSILVETSPVDSHHDPCVREEQVWLLESFDVLVSESR
jgi:hypothetical protein